MGAAFASCPQLVGIHVLISNKNDNFSRMILKAICFQSEKFALNFLAFSSGFDKFHLPSPSLYTLAR